jgi:prepilin-type N-terminal cleavage/methylation domain-containing protein
MKNHDRGFTLIETLLVLVIISIIIYSSIGYMQQRTLQMRMDRTSVQMQQILNAGLSFYVSNNRWPYGLAELQGQYLPPNTVPFKNPWGQNYIVDGSKAEMLHVFTSTQSASSTQAATAGSVIAGMLPLGYATSNAPGAASSPGAPDGTAPAPTAAPGGCGTSTTCYIVAAVNIPGQNLNNARAINFAGLYKHGACVPEPQCPVTSSGANMTPQIFVAPVQVAGTFEGGLSTSNPAIYPISGFAAYATKGPDPTTPPNCDPTNLTAPPLCDGGGAGAKYWRVCMQVVTERGLIRPTADSWGDNQVLMALTRCVSPDEQSGSTFNVFTN